MTHYDPYTAQQAATETEARKFEREKAAIKSYEDGIDRWDGPVWGYETFMWETTKMPGGANNKRRVSWDLPLRLKAEQVADDAITEEQKTTAQQHSTPSTRDSSPAAGLGDH